MGGVSRRRRLNRLERELIRQLFRVTFHALRVAVGLAFGGYVAYVLMLLIWG